MSLDSFCDWAHNVFTEDLMRAIALGFQMALLVVCAISGAFSYRTFNTAYYTRLTFPVNK